MFLWVNIHISDIRLVLGDVPIGLNDGRDPPGHGVREGGEEGLVLAEDLPGLLDLLDQLVQVGAGRHCPDDCVELAPEILNRIQVAGLPNPVQDLDVVLGKPLLDAAGGVARGSVLHEDGAPCLPQTRPKMLLQDVFVHLGVHLLVLGNKIQTAKFAVPEGSPDHDFLRMFYGAANHPRVVSGDGGGAAHALAVSEAFPELDVGLVRPTHLLPLPLPPRPLPLGPVKAAGLLGGSEEGLGGGHPGRDAKILGDALPDGGLVKRPERGNLTLKAHGCQEGIIVEVSLDPPLEPVSNLPILTSRPGTRDTRGGAGETAVSRGIWTPGPGGHGGSPPVSHRTGRDTELLRDFSGSLARLQHCQGSDFDGVAAMQFSALLLSSCSSHDGLIATDTNFDYKAIFMHCFGSNTEKVQPGGSTEPNCHFRYDINQYLVI